MHRAIEFILSLGLIVLMAPLLLIIWLLLAISTASSGLFIQDRIGQHADIFSIYKFKSMHEGQVTSLGRWLRKSKLDELPQLWNILKGDMSFVGPRPDLPGYYDKLKGEDRKILQLKPGLTSLAAIKYKDEESILAQQESPQIYNDEVLFPDKVKMNLEYLQKRSLSYDLKIILLTLASIFKKVYLPK